MIIDAGPLISIDNADRVSLARLDHIARRHQLHTTAPVLAQVWREPQRQALLHRALKAMHSIHDLTAADVPPIGELLAATETRDVVDAHLAVVARRRGMLVWSSDPVDLRRLGSDVS